MRISIRGKVLYGFAAAFLTAISFYFQPTAEAKTAFSSLAAVQQINQTDRPAPDLQTENQPQTIAEPSSETSENNADAPPAGDVSEARSFRATAYCLQGRTANGGGVRRGIVAADPRVLPLGTRIQVSAGSYSGTYTVADTGGSVKGRILDIWVPSCSEAIRFGRKNISVSVVGGGSKKSKSNG